MLKSKLFTAGVLVAATALFLPGVAQAQEKSATKFDHRVSRIVKMLDTNNDEKVSFKEITDEQGRMIGAIDVDGDGELSVDEFKRRGRLLMSLRTTTYFDLMDVNGDGKLTAEEISAPAKRWFDRYDENKDGTLEASEVPSHPWGRRGGSPRRK